MMDSGYGVAARRTSLRGGIALFGLLSAVSEQTAHRAVAARSRRRTGSLAIGRAHVDQRSVEHRRQQSQVVDIALAKPMPDAGDLLHPRERQLAMVAVACGLEVIVEDELAAIQRGDRELGSEKRGRIHVWERGVVCLAVLFVVGMRLEAVLFVVVLPDEALHLSVRVASPRLAEHRRVEGRSAIAMPCNEATTRSTNDTHGPTGGRTHE